MFIIYLTEKNTERLAVTFKNIGFVKIQKFEDVSDDKNIIYEVNPIETFVGKFNYVI